jgi:L-rhamnose-H+ transport protein
LLPTCGGIALKEWNGISRKTKTTIIFGIFTILLSVILVGIGNALKE